MRPKPQFASATGLPIGSDMKPTASPPGKHSIRNWHCCQDRRNEVVDEQPRRKTRLPESNRLGKPHGSPLVLPDTPEVMQAWIIRWQRFTEQVTAWNGIRLKCEEDEERITTLRAQLVDACPITRTANTLAEALALARQASSDAKSGQIAAQKLNDEVLRLRAALATAEAESCEPKSGVTHGQNNGPLPLEFSGSASRAYPSRRCRITSNASRKCNNISPTRGSRRPV